MSEEHEFEIENLEEVEASEDAPVNLPTGDYYIRNRNNYAGRNHIEDKSALPKRVNCPTDGPQELMHLERLHNRRYKISARKAPTNDINKLLFALIVDKEKAEEWIIRKRGQAPGPGHRTVYTIQKADGEGWVKQVQPGVVDPQIAVRHLRATKSLPPQFEAGALWNIQPLVLAEAEES